MKRIRFRAVISLVAAITVLCFSSIAVSAEKRSQTNVLPDTNTNITDKNRLAELAEIVEYAKGCDKNISIYYNDTKKGCYFYYRPKTEYKSACTIKASYCQYIIQSGADLDEKIKFTSPVKKSSSGLLSADKAGTYFTVRELISISIIYSDNMSYRLLFNRFGYKGYNEYIASLGLSSPRLTESYEFAQVTAKDIGKCLKEIYRYSEENKDYFLVDLMKNTTWTKQIPSGTKAVTAHKFGNQGDGGNYHDSAIVYANEPYVLAIFTDIDAASEGANEPFVKIAAMVEELHNKLHKRKASAKPVQQTSQDEDKNVTVHHLSYEEYLEMLDSDGNFEVIDECDGDCYYYVEGVGRIN